MIMGILNITPDSFYAASRVRALERILEMAGLKIAEGADILDIGGCSTRPGALEVSEIEELNRVIPALKLIREKFPEILISVDTFRSNVAQKAVDAGADIINDVSGGDYDEKMFATVAALKVPYILMHMRGNPQNMIYKTEYDDLISDIIKNLKAKIEKLKDLGVQDIIIDPGIGFAKNKKQNFEIIRKLSLFEILDKPILIGLSRKKFIREELGVGVEFSLNGTTILNTLAVLNGADIIRVHDVKEAVEIRKLLISNIL